MIPFYFPGDDEVHGPFPHTLKIHKLNDHVLPHTHNFIEYNFVIRGTGIEIINGVERELQPGTFTLLLPHQVHEIRVHPAEELQLYVGAIGLQAIFGSDDSAAELNQLILRAGTEGEPSYRMEEPLASHILATFGSMYDEIRSDLSWSRLLFKSKLIESLILFDRNRKSGKSEGTDPAPINKKGRMWAIILYVFHHFREDITLESLAEKFYLSVPHISSSFKPYIGDHFHSFLEKIRISHACSLLISGNEPITAIGFEVGFKSYPTFSRVFQSRMGTSPSGYRARKHK